VARRAAFINQARQEFEGVVLLLDSGDALMGTQLSIQANGEPMVEAMNVMGYDAVGIGAYELLQGVDILLARLDEAAFPFLSANLVLRDGSLLAASYTVLERDGLRIGVVGISEPDGEIFMRTSGLVGVIKTRNAIDVLAQLLPEIRAKADIVIVLSRLGLDQDQAVAAQVPGIDIIIGGRSRTLMDEPIRVGQTVIVQQGYQGEWIGRTEVSFDSSWQIVSATTQAVALTPDYPDDPQLAELAQRWNQKLATTTPAP